MEKKIITPKFNKVTFFSNLREHCEYLEEDSPNSKRIGERI
jgi:hypothetical protein